jgi:hypothetical protein
MVSGLNWDRNRGSVDQNSRISGIEKRTMAMRSRPRPKAHPILSGTPKKKGTIKMVSDPSLGPLRTHDRTAYLHGRGLLVG